MHVRIRAGSTERIQTPCVKNSSLVAITGSATIVIAIQRTSDGFWLDWNDYTFKAAAWTTRQSVMTEVSATLAPGEYYKDFNTASITNPTADDTYMIRVDDTSLTAKNAPFNGEIKIGQWVEQIFTAVAGVQADTDNIQTRLPAALVSGRMDASVGAMATDVIDSNALAVSAVAEIQTGLATAAAVAAVQADTDDLQTRLPVALVGGRIDSSVGAMANNVVTASAVATDAIDADALAASAVAEIQSGLATAAALALVQADTDDIQNRLPTSLSGGKMRAQVEGMDAGTVTAAAVATDAIDADALAASAVTEIQTGLATSAALATVQADTDDIQTRLPAALVGGRMDSYTGAMANNVVTAAAIATDAIDADAVATDAVAEMAAATDVVLTAAHGAGSWAGATASAVADAVWDEVIAGHSTAGSAGAELQAKAEPGDAMDLVTDAVDAAAVAASAVAEIQSGLATAAAVAAVQADTDDIQTRIPASLVGGRMRSHVEAMDAAVITAAVVATGAIDADALATDAVAEITSATDSVLTAAHGAGSWAGSTPGAIADAVWDEPLAGHLGVGSTGEALNSASSGGDPAAIADAVWDEVIAGHSAAGSAGAELQAKAEPGDAMDLVTDAVDSASVAASAVTEIQAGLATSVALANVQADTDDIQTRLPAALVGGRMDSSTGSMAADVLTAAALAASAVAEIQSGLATAAAVATVQADTDNIQTRLPGSLVAGRMDSYVGSMAAGVIVAATVATGAIDADALAADAVAEIQSAILSDATPFPGANINATISSRSHHSPADVDTQLSATHGAGSWEGGSPSAIADAVWDEALAGHLTPGSTGEALDTAATGGGLTPGAIADAVWDEVIAGHSTVGSAGAELQAKAEPGDSMALVPDAVDAAAIAASGALEIATTVDAALTSTHGVGAWTSPTIVAIADAVWDEPLSGHVGVGSAGAELQAKAEPGDSMALVPDAVDAAAVAASGAAEVAVATDALLSITHGAGSWEGLAAADIADAVWDEQMEDHQITGSTGANQQHGVTKI